MMPYKSLEEAEGVLGRRLTLAETLWFKYSANKTDYALHFHNVIFFFFFYTIVTLPFILIELSGYEKFNKYKVQPKEKKSLREMLKCYIYVMKLTAFAIVPLHIISYPTTKWIGIRTGLSVPSGWEIFCQLLVYMVIEDYTNYWLHRMLHSNWGYEKIHKVHHEYEAPIALSAPYAHWAEIFILGLPAFLGPMVVPGHTITYWLWFVLRQIESLDIHSGYEFPWSPTKYIPFYVGAAYHDYHHYVGQRSKSNFASAFTYCDYLYGTHKGYQYAKQISKKLASLSNYDSIAENHKLE